MAEQDFKRAMMQDPVLLEEAGLPREAAPDDTDMRCPMCGASATKILEAAQGGGMGGMGGGMMGGMKRGA